MQALRTSIIPYKTKKHSKLSAFLQDDVRLLLSLFGSDTSEAIAAVYRTITLWLERNLCFAAANCASGCEEFTRATCSTLAIVAARLATLWLILESTLSVELLLSCGKDEILSAILTY